MKLASKAELLEILEKIQGTPVQVIGDFVLDRYAWGKVERISPEAPVPIVHVVRMEDRLGCAGNVVRNLASMGARPIACGVVGDDAEGQMVRNLLEESGTDASGIVIDPSRPTIVKTRVLAQNQQMIRIDWEEIHELDGAKTQELLKGLDRGLPSSKALIVSDYGKGVITDHVLKDLAQKYTRGELSLARRPLFIDPHPRNYSRYSVMSVAKPNRKEAEAAAGEKIATVEDAFRVAEILLKKWNSEIMVISLGEDGMVVRRAGSPDGLHLETSAQEVFDVSGAGDTVTAVYTAALSVGSGPISAGILANIAAGIVVSEVGTAAIKLEKLKDGISKWEL